MDNHRTRYRKEQTDRARNRFCRGVWDDYLNNARRLYAESLRHDRYEASMAMTVKAAESKAEREEGDAQA